MKSEIEKIDNMSRTELQTEMSKISNKPFDTLLSDDELRVKIKTQMFAALGIDIANIKILTGETD